MGHRLKWKCRSCGAIQFTQNDFTFFFCPACGTSMKRVALGPEDITPSLEVTA